MRTFGALLITVGLFGFFYVSSEMGKAEPLPQELGWREALDHPTGRLEMARYGCALAGGLGILLLMFPKGR